MSFHYLGTPYSKFEGGLDGAFRLASEACAKLIHAGVPVFSPIVHSHPVAQMGGIDPLDWKLWLDAAEPMMRAACGLLIFKAPGWHRSFGISQEVKTFRAMGKPVRAITPRSINDAGVHAVLRYAASPATQFTTLADECVRSGRKWQDIVAEREALFSKIGPVAQPEECDPSSTSGGVEVAGSNPAGAAISQQAIEEAVAQAVPVTDEALELPAFLRRADADNRQYADMTGMLE